MSELGTIALIIGGFFLIKFINTGTAIANLKFVLRSASLQIQGLAPMVNLVIGVQNIASTSFTVYAITGVLYLNGTAVANINSIQPVAIAPLAETPYSILLNPNVSTLANDIVNIMQGNSSLAATIRFVGSVNVDNVQAPIDISYNLV